MVLFAALAEAPLANIKATAVKRTSTFAFRKFFIVIVDSHLSLSFAVLTGVRLPLMKIN